MLIKEKREEYRGFKYHNFVFVKPFFLTLFIDFLIKVFEFLLFIFALFFASPFFSAILLLVLLFLYYFSYKNNLIEKEEKEIFDIISKYFGFPLILFIFMFISYDHSLKLAVIAFSAQGAMKALIKNV